MKIAIDSSRAVAAYSRAFQRLKELPGFDQQAVLRAEAGVILKTWAARTKPTTKTKAERRMLSGIAWRLVIQKAGGSNPYGITVNDGSRGGFRGEVWFRTANKKWQQAGVINASGSFTPSWLHFRSADWDRIQHGAMQYAAFVAKRRPMVQASLGLARQSIVQAADDLKIDLAQVSGGGNISASAIGQTRSAVASNGSSYKNGSGSQGGDGSKAFVELMTHLPYGGKIGMDRTLAVILIGRAKYIQTAYEKGAFTSIDNVTRAFPEVFKQATIARRDAAVEAALVYE